MTYSIAQVLFALILSAFAVVLIDALIQRVLTGWTWRARKRRMRACHLCGTTYAEDRKVKKSRCPHCSADILRSRPRRLG